MSSRAGRMKKCHPEEPAQPASRRALPDCKGKRFAIVVARFYPKLAGQLVDGATRALRECGAHSDDIQTHDVPGCFELPLGCKRAIDDNVDGVVALGIVIRGETPHFDFIAGECARGIMNVQLATGVPIGFGVLTTETLAQAEERSDPKRGDKGYHAALAAASQVDMPSGSRRVGFR
jgi:6,7-dimethyl-8-ribityllumazine synthase